MINLTSSFLFIIFSFVQCAYLSIESTDCVLLTLLALNAILITSSVNALCLSILNLYFDFNNNLLFFIDSL